MRQRKTAGGGKQDGTRWHEGTSEMAGDGGKGREMARQVEMVSKCEGGEKG